MNPATFDYVHATSLDDALQLLGELGDEARPLAGGQSLIPLMRLRLARPTAIVDLAGIEELYRIEARDGRLRVGSMVRHVDLERSEAVRRSLPILAEIAGTVGDGQVRNMGTLGGNVSHGDPAGDYPALCVMLDAVIVTSTRRIPAADFFQGPLMTSLVPGEVVVELDFPVAAGRHHHIKHGHRLFDWAIVGVAVQQLDDGWRVGLTNVGPVPVRALAVEQVLADGGSIAEAAQMAIEGLAPSGDLQASPEYKRHLAKVLVRRSLDGALHGQD